MTGYPPGCRRTPEYQSEYDSLFNSPGYVLHLPGQYGSEGRFIRPSMVLEATCGPELAYPIGPTWSPTGSTVRLLFSSYEHGHCLPAAFWLLQHCSWPSAV